MSRAKVAGCGRSEVRTHPNSSHFRGRECAAFRGTASIQTIALKRAEWAAAARPDGRSNPLDRNGEHISHAALGLDDTRRARVTFELAPQAKNLHVDAAIEDILMEGSAAPTTSSSELAECSSVRQ